MTRTSTIRRTATGLVLVRHGHRPRDRGSGRHGHLGHASTASRTGIALGETVRITGSVSPSQGGRVYLQRYASGAWRNLVSSTLSSSRYAFTLKPNAVGSWKLRTYKPAAGSFSAGASPARLVSVAARPTVAWQFTNDQVDADSQPVYTYATTGVPSGYVVRLQRQAGTAGAWQNVQTLSRSGQGTAPGVGQGQYVYRVVVLSPNGTAVVAQNRVLRSFADVPMGRLQNRQTRTVQINGQLFRYIVEVGYGRGTVLHFDKTSCRSVALSLGKDGSASSPGGAVYVVQETGDLQTVRIASNEIKQATVTLTGDAVDLDLEDASGDDGYSYLDATLSCSSADGLR